MGESRPVTIAALVAADVTLRPHEAVAIVVQLCGQLHRGGAPAPGIAPAISAATVTIDGTGAVAVVGGAPVEDEQTVSLAGRLLLEMLDHSASATDAVAPPRLRSTAVRAAMGGRQAFGTSTQLVAALRRHGPAFGETQAIRGLFERWADRMPQAAGRAEGRSDVLRRFLREAEQEAYRARVEASLPSAPAGPAAAARPRRRGTRLARFALVSALLLILAGAGLVFGLRGSKDDLPFVAPVIKPTPVLPRREPGWELLGRPQRADSTPPVRTLPSRQARHGGQAGELTAPQWEAPAPGR